MIRLSIRLGHGPSWAHSLSHEDRTLLFASEFVEIETANRKRAAKQLGKIKGLGGKVKHA